MSRDSIRASSIRSVQSQRQFQQTQQQQHLNLRQPPTNYKTRASNGNINSLSKSSSYRQPSTTTRNSQVGAGGDSTHTKLVFDRFGFIVDDDKPIKSLDNSNRSIPKQIKREAKWLNMMDNWDIWIQNERTFEKVKNRCRKGIPEAVRGQAWFYLSGAHLTLKKYPRLYERIEREPGDPQICDEIKKDLHRQYPNHERFHEQGGEGQRNLFNVLKCFSIVRKDIGYCQGLAPIAGLLLMQMEPSRAFWTLLSISDNFVPGYFIHGFQAIQLHGAMLFSLLKKFAPNAYRIFKKAEIDPVLVMFEWFMCLFARNLPWPTVLKLWDQLLCEGIIIIFKAAIVIIQMVVTSDYKNKDQYEVLQSLKRLPEDELEDVKFLPKVIKLKLSDYDLKHEHMKQLHKTNKNNNAARRSQRSK